MDLINSFKDNIFLVRLNPRIKIILISVYIFRFVTWKYFVHNAMERFPVDVKCFQVLLHVFAQVK